MKRFLQRYLGPELGIALVLIVILFIFAQMNEFRHSLDDRETLQIAGQELIITHANTPLLRKQGLSGRESLKEDHAMLFSFTKSDIYSFWMKDMHFPIDIFWIDEGGQIVYLHEYAHPDDYPEAYTPPLPARYVLETVAGFAQEYGITTGDYIEL